MKRVILWAIVAGFLILAATASYTFRQIYKGVAGITAQAKSTFPGDALEALSSFILSDSQTFEDRNTAIWALGQFADPDALPFLEKLNSEISEQGVPFDRSGGLSKYEIEKAIKWSKKGNLTSWMYKKIRQ
jgi:hypothetical protein